MTHCWAKDEFFNTRPDPVGQFKLYAGDVDDDHVSAVSNWRIKSLLVNGVAGTVGGKTFHDFDE